MKKRQLNILLVVLSLIFLVSCKNEDKAAETSGTEAGQTTTTTASGDEIKVNPAHGLPGHRCDLPVGAPLNNVTAGSTSNPTPTSNLPSTSVSPIRVDQTPDVNPPHGEPGHDCSIPVGQPLNK